jgi:hypothetical protein
MDRATDRIEQHLDDERRALRSNLEELEDRVRSTLDWRRQFRGNTAAFLGLAVGGGLLIGLMTARRRAVPAALEHPRRPAGGPASPYRASPYSDHRRRQLSLAWRGIESALIGLAASKLKDTLADMLPGFREQLARGQGNGQDRDGSTQYRG